MKLTLKEGKGYIPVAKIENEGKLSNEILYIDPNIKDDDDGELEMNELRDIDFSKYLVKQKPREAIMKQNQLAKHVYAKSKPVDEELLEMYKKIQKDSTKELRLKTGNFIPVPNTNSERNIYYVFGPSGSGKSHFTAMILKQFLKLNPDKDAYIFSTLNDDDVIDKLGKRIKRINIESLLDAPMNVEEIPKGSMLVFDDVDVIANKKLLDEVLKLENQLYQIGRHYNLSVIKTSHLGSDYKRTRVILMESAYIVCYPRSGSFAQIQYVLKTYAGMSAEEIERVRNVKSRWATIHTRYPKFVLTENECFLL